MIKTVPLKSLTTPIVRKAGECSFPILSITAGAGFISQKEKFGKEIAGAQYSKYIVINRGDFSYNKGNSKTYPQGCIYCLENCDNAAVPNVFYSFRFTSKDACPQYYKYVFESGFLNQQLRKLVNSGVRDDGLLNLYEKDFYSCLVPCPPLEEQRRIAEILGCCDQVIALKKELIAEKKKQKKALMQKLLNPDSGFRLPGFSGERKRTKMENIAPLQRGFDLPNSQLKQGEYPVVYSNGVMAFHNEFMVTAPGVVTGRSGTIGAVFYIENNFWPHNTSLWVTNFFNNIPLFVYHLYQFINIEKCASGSGVPTLNRNDVHKIEISIPCDRDEQKAIADILSAADKEIDLLEQELAQQEQKKKSLMQLLLTGIVRV